MFNFLTKFFVGEFPSYDRYSLPPKIDMEYRNVIEDMILKVDIANQKQDIKYAGMLGQVDEGRLHKQR